MNYYEKTIKSEKIYNGKILNLRRDRVMLPNGKESYREIVEHPGAVAIVALTPTGKVLLVKQFRKACEQELWEIPAGKIDEGEEIGVTAQRELSEETGYRAESMTKLLSFYTSPGFADEMIHVFLAQSLVETQLSPDEDEFLSLESFTWDEISQMLKQGELPDAKTVTGLLYAMSYLGVEF